jgi:hypothetical protein
LLFISDWSGLGGVALQRIRSARLALVSALAGLASLAYADLARQAASRGHPGSEAVSALVAASGIALILVAWRVRASAAARRTKATVCVALALWTVAALVWLLGYIAAAAILG